MTSTLPAGRYSSRGRRPRRRRLSATVLLAALGVLAGIAVALVAYRNLGSPPISAESTGFSLDSDSAVTVTFTVTRDEPGKPAVCILRALSLDGSETGRREVYIPPGAGSLGSYVGTIRTSQPPVTGNVFGCSYTVPSYLQPR